MPEFRIPGGGHVDSAEQDCVVLPRLGTVRAPRQHAVVPHCVVKEHPPVKGLPHGLPRNLFRLFARRTVAEQALRAPQNLRIKEVGRIADILRPTVRATPLHKVPRRELFEQSVRVLIAAVEVQQPVNRLAEFLAIVAVPAVQHVVRNLQNVPHRPLRNELSVILRLGRIAHRKHAIGVLAHIFEQTEIFQKSVLDRRSSAQAVLHLTREVTVAEPPSTFPRGAIGIKVDRIVRECPHCARVDSAQAGICDFVGDFDPRQIARKGLDSEPVEPKVTFFHKDRRIFQRVRFKCEKVEPPAKGQVYHVVRVHIGECEAVGRRVLGKRHDNLCSVLRSSEKVQKAGFHAGKIKNRVMSFRHAERQSGQPRLPDLLLSLHPFVGMPLHLFLGVTSPTIGGLERIEVLPDFRARVGFKATDRCRAGHGNICIGRIGCDPRNHLGRILHDRRGRCAPVERIAQIPFLHKMALHRIPRAFAFFCIGKEAIKIPPRCGKNLAVAHNLCPEEHGLQDGGKRAATVTENRNDNLVSRFSAQSVERNAVHTGIALGSSCRS